MFAEPLFHKVVSGEKTQTRRIIKPQPKEGIFPDVNGFFELKKDEQFKQFVPRYKLGEKLYLKEPYKIEIVQGKYAVTFAYSNEKIKLPNTITSDEILKVQRLMWKSKTGYCSKMFTVKGLHEHMQHFIEITGVHVEMLQDISDSDCFAEGIMSERHWGDSIEWFTHSNGLHGDYNTPREAYAALIDSINGRGTWESNPFVWVYDFQLSLPQLLTKTNT